MIQEEVPDLRPLTGNVSDHGLPVVEIFSTIQGEGYHTGKAVSFVRLAGCDLGCHWCDSKDSWNSLHWPRMAMDEIVVQLMAWPVRDVIISGGEPLYNDLTALSNSLKLKGFKIYLETSGAYPLTGAWDWICLSPKPHHPPIPAIYQHANELKVVIENQDDLKWAEDQAAKVSSQCLRYLQPEWSVRNNIVPIIVEYILNNPQWMLSLQSHKYIGIP